MEEFPAKTKAELRDIMNEYKGAYANVLSYSNLRFRLKPHRGYKLVPVNYPRRVDGYRHMEIDERDNRRPTFNVPSNMSFDKAFGMENVREFDETSMLMKWFHDGGIHDFVNHEYVHKLPSQRLTKASLDWEGGDGLATESAFRLLAPDEDKGRGTSRLLEFEKKTQTLVQQWRIVMACGVASFLRLCKVNVDISGLPGPLLDPTPI